MFLEEVQFGKNIHLRASGIANATRSPLSDSRAAGGNLPSATGLIYCQIGPKRGEGEGGEGKDVEWEGERQNTTLFCLPEVRLPRYTKLEDFV